MTDDPLMTRVHAITAEIERTLTAAEGMNVEQLREAHAHVESLKAELIEIEAQLVARTRPN